MAISLKQVLMEKFSINPTTKMLADLNKFCLSYEIRGDNPLCLNSPMLGVHRMYYLSKDVAAVFDICGIYKPDFERTIRNSGAINIKWKTVSNSFNVLIMWMVYCFLHSSLSDKQKIEGAFILLKLFHYRIFTGRVARQFKHGANPGVMAATIDNLSAKNDIKHEETNTWKLMIEEHCRRALLPNSLHYHTFDTFSPDDKIFYAISGLATSISAKIIVISEAYYKNHAAGISIGQRDATQINAQGERELRAMQSTMDTRINTLCATILNVNKLINYSHIKLTCALSFNVRPDMLRNLLEMFSAVATAQFKSGDTQKVIIGRDKEKIYVGYRLLVTELVQKTFRRCILENTIDINSNVAILERTRDIYRSSRVNDPDILRIKDSIDYFVQNNTKYTRESTLVSLRSALIIYLMISVLSQ